VAEVTLSPVERPSVVLTLTWEEALYVYSALNKVNPAHNQFGPDEDPVYDALGSALNDAGLDGVSVGYATPAR
jgi:hypothetical protein